MYELVQDLIQKHQEFQESRSASCTHNHHLMDILIQHDAHRGQGRRLQEQLDKGQKPKGQLSSKYSRGKLDTALDDSELLLASQPSEHSTPPPRTLDLIFPLIV